MKLTTGILAMAMMVGGAWAQNPDAIDTARSTAKSLQQKQANDTNPAPNAAGVTAKAKPAPGAPAPAVKPAAIPSSSPVSAAKPAPAAKPIQVSAQHNQLQRVNVVPGADGVQIEISSTQSVTPRLSKLKSPDRVVVELPETVIASSQNKIAVGSAGVKGVRIGMDGKTPPTTSVVIDLEKPLTYELTPGPAGKVILTLHSEGKALSVAKNNSAPVKVSNPAPAVKAAVPAAQPTAAAKSAVAVPKVAVAKTPASKSVVPASKPDPKQQAKAAAPAVKIAAPSAKIAAPAASAPVAAQAKTEAAPKQPKPEEKKWAMSGKRDPFFSPVVQQNGSGCATGKKCLEIGAINLRGVVKSDTGFIAVVTNNLNKAYFLRENDPVFNGYVVKITGDSVVFQETIQDKLGKSFTREVVKRIFTPAV
ncbi:MAG: AMIN domain-containing protein [Candidatus Sulfotelmatobacter sp.]|jgi:Tfp pilus assembly protein PilP